MGEKKLLFKNGPKSAVKKQDKDQDIGPTSESEIAPWVIAIIDDDEQVHQITTMVLKSFQFEKRRVKFLHAYSEAEGYKLFQEHKNKIAVCLLDVVMETEHAGLDLVKKIRIDLDNSITRIVLRTGQPGQAPEESVISEYDINDYKEKTELTSLKLRTLIYSCLRAYRDIISLEHTKKGLEEVIDASTKVFSHHYMDQFAKGILYQITSVLNFEDHALYGVLEVATAHEQEDDDAIRIISGIGEFETHIGDDLKDLVPESVLEQINRNDKTFFHYQTDEIYLACYCHGNHEKSILYLSGLKHRDELHSRLLNIFSRNVLIAFDNLYLKVQSDKTESEAMAMIGDALEDLSGETGINRIRVAEIAYILAKEYGMDFKITELIRRTALLIDMGKTGLNQSMLTKKDILTEEEKISVQEHVNISLEMLELSSHEAQVVAENLIRDHHERWDGSGYPAQKKGEEISLEGRITAIADVFDALCSPRCYREPWPIDKAFGYMTENAGSLFDPNIVVLLIKHKDEIEALYKTL